MTTHPLHCRCLLQLHPAVHSFVLYLMGDAPTADDMQNNVVVVTDAVCDHQGIIHLVTDEGFHHTPIQDLSTAAHALQQLGQQHDVPVDDLIARMPSRQPLAMYA